MFDIVFCIANYLINYPNVSGLYTSVGVGVDICVIDYFVSAFSSPEPKAYGELIVNQSSQRPCVRPCIRPCVCSHFQT